MNGLILLPLIALTSLLVLRAWLISIDQHQGGAPDDHHRP